MWGLTTRLARRSLPGPGQAGRSWRAPWLFRTACSFWFCRFPVLRGIGGLDRRTDAPVHCECRPESKPSRLRRFPGHRGRPPPAGSGRNGLMLSKSGARERVPQGSVGGKGVLDRGVDRSLSGRFGRRAEGLSVVVLRLGLSGEGRLRCLHPPPSGTGAPPWRGMPWGS